MLVHDLEIPGAKIIQFQHDVDIYSDDRGYFYECCNQDKFIRIGITNNWIQENQSYSFNGVIRGLHYQYPNNMQNKLVRVVKGEIFDVIVDLRKDSPTFLQWRSVILTLPNKSQLYIPSGCAHGFQAVYNDTIVLYKVDAPYDPKSEKCIRWDDPTLNIDWPIKNCIISEKDKNGMFITNPRFEPM